jgi:hypothetical protein
VGKSEDLISNSWGTVLVLMIICARNSFNVSSMPMSGCPLQFRRRQLRVKGMKGKTVTVRAIDHVSAREFFERYEHLGNCGLGVWHYGAVYESTLIGVISFGTACFATKRGLFSQITRNFGLKTYQICRGATIVGAPRNTASWLLSRTLRIFQEERGSCLVVAYADRVFNEMGTIYQACNGLYTGQTDPKNQANYIINGRWMSGWVVRKKYRTRSMDALRRIDKNVVKIPLTAKYRYVFVQAPPLKKHSVISALDQFMLPYPKRNIEQIPPMDIVALISRKVRGFDDLPI